MPVTTAEAVRKPSTAERRDPATVTAAEVMRTPVVSLSSSDTLATAWERLLAGHVHHLVVTEGVGHRVAGVLDDRQLAMEWPMGPLGPHRRRLTEVLPRDVHCVLPATPVAVVAETMTRERLDATPVVLADGTLVGIITSGDIVAFVARAACAG
ncbi:MAG: HPP family protein [Frankiaceae bacterium]